MISDSKTVNFTTKVFRTLPSREDAQVSVWASETVGVELSVTQKSFLGCLQAMKVGYANFCQFASKRYHNIIIIFIIIIFSAPITTRSGALHPPIKTLNSNTVKVTEH